MPDAVRLTVPDGVTLEAELERAPGEARAGAVLCHPHPQYGGSMRSIVISALFDALPGAGVTTLRFNFRGVEGSSGTFDAARGEREDALAAIGALSAALPAGVPMVLVGWSFGADVTLSIAVPALSGWVAIAPPLHYTDGVEVGRDPRPKLLVLGEHDEVCPPGPTKAASAGWAATETEVVPGASHFFVGRTDRVVALTLAFVDRVAPG